MTNNFQQEFRSRRLTAEEIARDAEVRRQVEDEFPPAPPTAASLYSLSEMLKEAIRVCGKTEYQVAKEAGVSQIVISRFLSGERDIRMATADKLVEALGLKLEVGA